MAKRAGDNLDELFRVENPTFPYSLTPENHQFASPATVSSPENSPHGSPPLTENNPFQFFEPELNRYIPLPETTVHGNPSFPDTLYDPPLGAYFSRLTLSSPSRNSPFLAPSFLGDSVPPNNSLIDPSVSMGCYPTIPNPQDEYREANLRSRRVQSAAMGQTGRFIQPTRGFPVSEEENSEGFGFRSLNSNYESDDHYNNGRSFVAGMNGRSMTIGPRSNQNGFQSAHNMGYGAPNNSNTIGVRRSGDNSSVLMSSFYNNNHQVYPLRQRSSFFSSLEELRGRIFLAAKDQHGCRFLQKKFEEGRQEDREMIFLEVKDHVQELMLDQFGNYLIQKFFDVCNQDQMTQMLLLVISDERQLLNICSDTHGTRAMQKLLEHLTTQEQRFLVMSVLRRITVNLTKTMNGHHVIQSCLKFFPSEDNKHLLNVVADNCLDIATDKSGCCVLQQFVAHAEGEPKQRLVAEITANALVLSEHPYGNYVVQYILGMRMPRVTADVLAQLKGSYVSLSMNKYGSNVVEKCLKESGEERAARIIVEIINSPNFLMVLLDPHGNYVAQSAVSTAKGTLRHAMSSLILNHYPFLHSHPHGKRVLARVKSLKQRA